MTRALPLLALVVAPALAQDDPRPAIVELALADRLRPALVRTDTALAQGGEAARASGLGLLRGDLLERTGRYREAVESYAAALAHGSGLEPWARLRLASLQERLGHPEVAAGLAATLLAGDPPEELVPPALELFHRALETGGDCRLLGGLRREQFSGDERRLYDLTEAECWLRAGRVDDASRRLHDLLSERLDDALAWEAAARLSELPAVREPATARLVGLAAYQHREFTAALRLLRLGSASSGWFDPGAREVAYAVARSLFWLGRYGEAARRFQELAEGAAVPTLRADAYCQLGRSLELSGRLQEAAGAFQRCVDLDPSGEWAGTGMLGRIRLASITGDDDSALTQLSRLEARRDLASVTARAALFLAVGELERGRTGRVAALLDRAERTRQTAREEIEFWRGRLAEAQGDPERAIRHYLEVAGSRPYHPLTETARRRLAAPGLARAARSRAEVLVARGDPASLHAAELLYGRGTPEALGARFRGLEMLSQRSSLHDWVTWQPVPITDWPLWKTTPRKPGDLLVGLGLFAEPGSGVARHFPASDPRLAFTAGAILVADEHSVRRGVAIAETQFERRPREVPLDWVAPPLRRILYPLPWEGLIRAQAEAFGVDPALLAAVIREESRFDPRALSPAAARGLTQLVLPTAGRLTRTNRFGDRLEPEDLFDPGVSIPLGAAYLAELSRRFAGAEPVVVAAYNAGEDQAALWRRSCVTANPEEYLAKIGFRETKAYVVRVLETRNAYRELWGPGDR
jgi:soluble lytic murein transglycosylase